MAPRTGFEPAYSNYSFNDRLEGGTDTGAKFLRLTVIHQRQ